MMAILLNLWRWRWWMLLSLSLIGAGAAWLHVKVLKADLALARMEAAHLRQEIGQQQSAIVLLKRERRAISHAVEQRLIAASKATDRLTDISREIAHHDSAKDCPLSPALDLVLDRLSEPGPDDHAR